MYQDSKTRLSLDIYVFQCLHPPFRKHLFGCTFPRPVPIGGDNLDTPPPPHPPPTATPSHVTVIDSIKNIKLHRELYLFTCVYIYLCLYITPYGNGQVRVQHAMKQRIPTQTNAQINQRRDRSRQFGEKKEF